MDQLPLEILENILTHSKLDVADVVNFASTCQYLRSAVLSSNVIWRQKILQRWPTLAEILVNRQAVLYYDELRYIYQLRARTRAILETMPPRFYKKYELSDSDLDEWGVLMNEREVNYHYLVLDLMHIVNTHVPIWSIETVPLNTPGNKTLQFYANKVLRFIRQLYLSKIWKNYISLPPRRQILEIGAAFVNQWCETNVEVKFEDISAKLDDLAEKVKQHLREVNPNHSLFKASEADLALWRIENLTQNQWNVPESRQLITIIREELLIRMNFSGNNQSYYMPQNSFINIVLEKRQGLPITMSIVFEAVARRLGLRCDPISFPAHFLLRFAESLDPDADWYYIDVFNGRKVVRRGACPHSRLTNEQYAVATAVQVVERMANNLEVSARQHAQPNGRIKLLRSSLELLKLVNPKDISALVSLARLYMLHNMDTKPLENFLLSQEFEVPEQAQRIVHMLRDYEVHHAKINEELFNQVEAAQRTSNLKFAVGMVMTHMALNYNCVIYDWDPVCLAAPEWQMQNNVDKLALKSDQPFYNVLVEDGSHRYVAQENLRPTDETSFLYMNDDLGRHFSHFFETHFVPNAEKEQEYPADKKVRHMFYRQMRLDTRQVD